MASFRSNTPADFTSDDILGKEAIDREGAYLGTVMKLHLDREKKSVIGITIDQGFLKPDLFVGIDFVDRFGVDAIFLNRIPFERYHGLSVFTYDGKPSGIVRDHAEANGKLKFLEVELADRYKMGKSRRKAMATIAASKIDRIGGSVILARGYLPQAQEKLLDAEDMEDDADLEE